MLNKGGRPSHVPTDRDRKTVQAMASYGIPQAEIAEVIGVALMTLRKHYSRELTIGSTVATSAVAQRLFEIATSTSECGATVAAQKFWLECRAGWRKASADAPERDDGLTGKKAKQAQDAASAGRGTEWGEDLIPPGLPN